MFFNPWTFVFQVVNFLVLMVLLKRLVYDPLHRAIDARQAAIVRTQAEAETARREAAAIQQRLATELADIERQRQEMMAQAHEAIGREQGLAGAAAEEAAQRRRLEVEAEVSGMRQEAMAALGDELAGMAVEVVERLLQQVADTTLHRQLCRRLLARLQEPVDATASDHVAAPSSPGRVVVETSAEIDPAILEQISTALAARLGRTASLVVESHAELISGARVLADGQVWDASLAGLLSRTGHLTQGVNPHGATPDPASSGGA